MGCLFYCFQYQGNEILKKWGAHVERTKKTSIGTELLVNALRDQGAEIIFGYPGGAALHIYDEFFRQNVNHVLARHEQGAGHMADGYARVAGRVGVAVTTSGPGATNIVTAVATAQMDSVPLVVISGQVTTFGIGKDAFQETDVVSLMTPITKYAYQVEDAKDIPRIIKEAFYLANSGRKGPVLVDIPKDIGVQEVALEDIDDSFDLPGYNMDHEVDLGAVAAIKEALLQAEKPLLLVGNGVVKSEAHQELRDFAHQYNIPVTHTLLGIGLLASDDPLNLGLAGMHGTYAANMALMETDCLLNIGSRFDDRVASNPDNFAPDAKIIHVDIDLAEIGKIMEPDIALLADAKTALGALLQGAIAGWSDKTDWLAHQAANQALHPTRVPEMTDAIRPQAVLDYLGKATDGQAYIVTDVGQHQMWAAQYYPYQFPGQNLTSGGLGTMGYGVPATIGAAFAADEKHPVVGIIGDGGFQMTNQELNIIQHYGIQPKFIILNNTVLGMVHQWQHAFYSDRYSHSEFGSSLPDFVKLSEALGVKAAKVTDPADMQAAVDEMLAYDGAYVLEVLIDKYERVTPMVPSGKANNEMEGLS